MPPMTPTRAKEERIQQLMLEYNERMRALTRDKQAILQNQAMWMGKVEADERQGDREQRMRQRSQLIQQLQQEQAASEALVEALKQNKSLREAQSVAQQVAEDMHELRAKDQQQAGRGGAGNLMTTPPGLMQQLPRNSQRQSQGQGQGLGQGLQGQGQGQGQGLGQGLQGQGQGQGWQGQGDSAYGAGVPARASGSSARGTAAGRSSGTVGAPATGPLPASAAPSTVVPASASPPMSGLPRTSARKGTGVEGQGSPGTGAGARAVPGSPAHSHGSHTHRHEPQVHFDGGATSTSLISYEPEARHTWQQLQADHALTATERSHARSVGAAPADSSIEQLKQQVQALQSAIEQQMMMQHQQQQQQLLAQQQQQQQVQQPQIIMMPPPYMYPPQPPPVQQPAAQPQASQSSSGLPSELQQDPDVRRAHLEYQKEMALLKMQIERARGEAELQQVRQTLDKLRGSAGLGPSMNPVPTPEHDVVMTNVESERTPPDSSAGQWEHYEEGEEEEESDDESEEGDDEVERLVDRPGAGDVGGGGRGGGDGVLMYADVLNVYLHSAGPCDKRGTYRVRVVLYDGFQPLAAGAGLVVGSSSARRKPNDSGDGGLACVWNETLVLRGLRLSATMMLVFELYLAKQTVAGLPTREGLVAWAYTSILTRGELIQGSQSIPFHRLPLMITAQRKFSYNSAMLDFSITKAEGEPGDITSYAQSQPDRPQASGPQRPAAKEDVPGVPVEAWSRVARGVPPMDPYTPGEGFVLMVDGAHFLPANVTISKVVASVWSSDKRQLVPQYFEAVSLPDSDAYSPRFMLQTTLGQASEKFDNATATLLFAVHTICRWERSQRMVGYACLPVFVDPNTEQQPASRNVRDYVLNQGAFQVPLHVAPPPSDQLFRGDALESAVPRLPCASLLVRILTPEMAKVQRRKPHPLYEDRVYDTMRSIPTPVERKLFVKYMSRRPLAVREAARILTTGPNGAALPGGRRVAMGVIKPSPPPRQEATGPGATKSGPSLMNRLMGRSTARGVAEAHLVDRYDSEDYEEEAMGPGQGPGEQWEDDGVEAGVLPSTDAELMDWMEDKLRHNTQAPLNYNLASEYFPDLGFYVAADAAMRLDRQLPSACLMTFAPPGSFYLDNPVVDDMKATLDYDMSACLANPRWTDGFQQFDNIVYEPGLAIIFDVRLLIHTTGASAPAGWTVLPVFERMGPFVATGTYHLPLFQGVPSRFIVQEMASKGDVESVILAQLKSGRLRVSEDCPSVLVRLMDGPRQGQVDMPAGKGPGGLEALRLPSYVSHLGPKHLATMRKELRNKTYAQAKPKNMTEEAWVQELNDCILKVAGLEANALDVDEEDEDEVEDEPEEAPRRMSKPGGKPGSRRVQHGRKGSAPGHATHSVGPLQSPTQPQPQPALMPALLPPVLPSQPPFLSPPPQPQAMMMVPAMAQPQQPMMMMPVPMQQQPGGMMAMQAAGGAVPMQQAGGMMAMPMQQPGFSMAGGAVPMMAPGGMMPAPQAMAMPMGGGMGMMPVPMQQPMMPAPMQQQMLVPAAVPMAAPGPAPAMMMPVGPAPAAGMRPSPGPARPS